MSTFIAELVGTMILIILGDGVVANVVLHKTKGNSGGWIVITAGWGFAVAVAIYCTGAVSGGHFNPAVTIAMAALGKLSWAEAPVYLIAQMIGAMLGAVLVWLAYLPHWKETTDKGAKLAVFCTGPAIRHSAGNLICEIVGTFVLVLGALAIGRKANLNPDFGWSSGFGPALVGMLVWSIGLSLGGPTGYAINPARDLGPRIMHAILPIHGKGDSDWGYAWVPVVGPIVGGLIAAMFYQMMW
jgi:glycerol uptake facilitator protein